MPQNWVAFGDPKMAALPKAFAPPSVWPGIFISPLAKASFRRCKIVREA
jgi:hypothetical protein